MPTVAQAPAAAQTSAASVAPPPWQAPAPAPEPKAPAQEATPTSGAARPAFQAHGSEEPAAEDFYADDAEGEPDAEELTAALESAPRVAPPVAPSPVDELPAAKPTAQVDPQPQSPQQQGQRTWEGFLAYVASRNGSGMVTGLSQAKGEVRGTELVLSCHNETHSGMLESGDNNARLRRMVSEYFGPDMNVVCTCAFREPVKSDGLIQREMQDHPAVMRVREAFECRDPALVYPRN